MGRGTCFNEEREEGHSARCIRQVYTSLAAVQRRLDAEASTVLIGVVILVPKFPLPQIARRGELSKFVDSAAEEFAPAVARLRADLDMA